MKKRFLGPVIVSAVISVLLSVSVAAFLWDADTVYTKDPCSPETVNVLVAGIDEAARNTDVLMLISVNRTAGTANVLQIPRDTYLSSENENRKINSLFPSFCSQYGIKSGAEKTCTAISSLLGISIDGYAVFTVESFAKIVDSLHGVPVHVPKAFSYYDPTKGEDVRIEKGKQTLFGSAAVAFIRHRSSYANGDLGRLDAHVCFMKGLLTRLQELSSLRDYLDIYQKNRANLLTNLKEKDIISIIMACFHRGGNLSARIMRLPGEASHVRSEAWYYVLNRDGCVKMLMQYFCVAADSFDPDKRFLREENEAFRNIYTAPSSELHVYSLWEE